MIPCPFSIDFFSDSTVFPPFGFGELVVLVRIVIPSWPNSRGSISTSDAETRYVGYHPGSPRW